MYLSSVLQSSVMQLCLSTVPKQQPSAQWFKVHFSQLQFSSYIAASLLYCIAYTVVRSFIDMLTLMVSFVLFNKVCHIHSSWIQKRHIFGGELFFYMEDLSPSKNVSHSFVSLKLEKLLLNLYLSNFWSQETEKVRKQLFQDSGDFMEYI